MSLSSTSSSQKHYKFIFKAFVKNVSLALKFPCVVSIIWKRGQKASQVKERKPIEKGSIDFNENLEIECNMVFDQQKKVFEEKKTKFTVLIFSQKGNKQAGQVHLDVSELLNSKSKSLEVEKKLQKCPDRKAKLKLVLSGYMKEQITKDMVSHRSKEPQNIESFLVDKPSDVKPNFKKKKNEALIVGDDTSQDGSRKNALSSRESPIKTMRPVCRQSADKSQKKVLIQQEPNISSKENVAKLKALEQQNYTLKQSLKQMKDLQIQNQGLRHKYEQASKKAKSYYKKKYAEMKQEETQLKQKAHQVSALQKHMEELEGDFCECKEKIGKIFNFAIITGNEKLMEALEEEGM